MEELYLLLAERGTHTETISSRLAELSQSLRSRTSEAKLTPFAKSQEGLEVSKFVNQMKRSEKVRVIKENDLIDIVFNLKSFDWSQNQRFQDISYETMKGMRREFVYKKPKENPDAKDIASLYLNFFILCDLKAKIEDLKRVYVDNKLRGLPIVSVLVKWLVELSREHFKGTLSDFVREFETQNQPAAAKNDKAPLKMVSPKAGRFFRPSREQKDQEADQEMQRKTVKKENIDSNLKVEKPKPQLLTEPSSILDTLTISHMNIRQSPTSVGSPTPTTMVLTTASSMKQLEPPPPTVSMPVKKKNPLIQARIYISGLGSAKHFDPIEDLDFACAISMNLFIGVNRGTKKQKGRTLVTIDTDKKREAISQAYKNLYSKNSDIEKSISNYQSKCCQRDNITPSTQPKKTEISNEDYSIEFFEKFYQYFNRSPPFPYDLSLKPKLKQKPPKNPKTVISPYLSTIDPKRPLTGSLLRRARSNGSIPPGLDAEKTKSSENTIVNRVSQKMETSVGKENRNSVSRLDTTATSEPHSDNYFRIIKIANFLHKVPPKGQKEQTTMEVDESSFNVPLHSLTGEMTSGPLAESMVYDGESSTKAGNRLSYLGSYLKKITSGEEETGYDRNSIGLPLRKNGNGKTGHAKKSLMEDKQLSFEQEVQKEDSRLIETLRAKNVHKTRGLPGDYDCVPKSLHFGRKISCETEDKQDSRGTVRVGIESSLLKTNFSFVSDNRGENGEKKEELEQKNGRGKRKGSQRHRKITKPAQGGSNKNVIACYE